MSSSWTFEKRALTTDGAQQITKTLLVESTDIGGGGVQVLAKSDQDPGCAVLFWLDPNDADALASALKSSADRVRKER